MNKAGIIIKKELYRVFKDKKLVFSLFILPAILVIGIYSLMGFMIESMNNDIESHISNVYIVNAPDSLRAVIDATDYEAGAEVKYLSDAEYQNSKASLEEDVLNGNVDLIVYVEQQFGDKVSSYKAAGDAIANITINYNSTENYSSQAYAVFDRQVSSAWQTSLLAERLGNLEQLTVYTTQTVPIEKEEKANKEFISMMLPYLLVMMLFAGAMSIGVDAIAGEKERGTLASMLLSPVNRGSIVFGKLVSMALLSGLSAVVYAISMVVALPMMSKSMGEGISASEVGLSMGFTPAQIIMLLLIMLALVYLFVALIGCLGTIAKDSRTAGSLISPIYIVVIVLGMMTMFSGNAEVSTATYAIPVYGNALAIKDLVTNELTTVNFLASFCGTVLAGAIATFVMAKLFNSEKFMFNA